MREVNSDNHSGGHALNTAPRLRPRRNPLRPQVDQRRPQDIRVHLFDVPAEGTAFAVRPNSARRNRPGFPAAAGESAGLRGERRVIPAPGVALLRPCLGLSSPPPMPATVFWNVIGPGVRRIRFAGAPRWYLSAAGHSTAPRCPGNRYRQRGHGVRPRRPRRPSRHPAAAADALFRRECAANRHRPGPTISVRAPAVPVQSNVCSPCGAYPILERMFERCAWPFRLCPGSRTARVRRRCMAASAASDRSGSAPMIGDHGAVGPDGRASRPQTGSTEIDTPVSARRHQRIVARRPGERGGGYRRARRQRE